jgi:(2Fe-2S) ferredoxin
MGLIDYGNQNITFRYKQEDSSAGYNGVVSGIFDVGIYTGGALSFLGTTVTIDPFTAWLNDSVNPDISLRVRTSSPIIQNVSGLGSNTDPAILCLQFTWQDIESVFADFLIRKQSDPAFANEIIIGRVNYSDAGGTVIASLDTLTRTTGFNKAYFGMVLPNAALLATYTQTESNLADAVAKKHAHANNATLDKIIEPAPANTGDYFRFNGTNYVPAPLSTDISNLALLITYAQTEADLADAVTKKHAHANQTVLDSILSSSPNVGDALVWNGTNYVPTALDTGESIIADYTINYTDISTAALTNFFNLLNLPAGAILENVIVKSNTAFVGTGISILSSEVGIVGNTSAVNTSFDMLASVTSTNFQNSNFNSPLDFNAVQLIATFTAVGANLDQLTAGQVLVRIKYRVVA